MPVFSPEVRAAAADFWNSSGVRPDFPRRLEPAIFSILPIAVVRLPALKLRAAARWLTDREIGHERVINDRRLHGYLVAHAGAAVVFLDGADHEREQEYSLAHEVAHFVLDYLEPRRRAVRAMGSRIIDVLDGKRLPTPEERLSGLFGGIRLGTFAHSLERRDAHGIASDEVTK